MASTGGRSSSVSDQLPGHDRRPARCPVPAGDRATGDAARGGRHGAACPAGGAM